MAAQLIQLYYEDNQLKEIYPFAVAHYNAGLTVFFENYWIKELVLATDADKIAVCSWKLRQKLKTYIGTPRPITQELLNSDYEVLTFTRNTKHHKMIAAANVWHAGFSATFDRMLQIIGKSRPHEVKIPIYQNHHSTRTDIYQDYVKTYLSPAMEAITDDKELNAMAMVDSKYADLTNQSGEKLKEKIGIGYWPIAPFLLERLFSVYVHNQKLNVTYL